VRSCALVLTSVVTGTIAGDDTCSQRPGPSGTLTRRITDPYSQILRRAHRFVAARTPAHAAVVGVAAGTDLAVSRRAVSWFRVSDGRLEYRGRITKTPFTRWCETKKG